MPQFPFLLVWQDAQAACRAFGYVPVPRSWLCLQDLGGGGGDHPRKHRLPPLSLPSPQGATGLPLTFPLGLAFLNTLQKEQREGGEVSGWGRGHPWVLRDAFPSRQGSTGQAMVPDPIGHGTHNAQVWAQSEGT